ncbi:MAG: transcriptional regulator [Acidimicrobiia bacterium]
MAGAPLVPDAVRTAVLLGMRLRGVAGVDDLAAAAGLDPAGLAPVLEDVEGRGWAVRRAGRVAGHQLTPAGRAELERRLARELDAHRAREAVTDAYRRFLALNGPFLDACARWQVRSGPDGTPVVNDHLDPTYDAALVDELGALHDRVVPVLGTLAAALDRYRRYEPALAGALTRVRAGEVDHFTKPIVPSYHTVWFELHEDLLATLGIERASEAH